MTQAPFSEPTTSKEAAKSLNQTKRKIDKERIYQFIKAQGVDGATDQEIESFTGISGNTLRPRRGELQRAGVIVKAVFKRKTESGRRATVWVIP